jgi:hypothetical protein
MSEVAPGSVVKDMYDTCHMRRRLQKGRNELQQLLGLGRVAFSKTCMIHVICGGGYMSEVAPGSLKDMYDPCHMRRRIHVGSGTR